MFPSFILCFVCIAVPLSSLNVLEMFPEYGKMEETVASLQASVKDQASKLPSPAQAIYTRWGSSSCYDSKLLYHGMTAGGHSDHSGSASNLLCLVHDPYFTGRTALRTEYSAGIWGAIFGDNVLTTSGRGYYQDLNVPCAVCVASPATSAVMIPGKRECPAGMRYQYWGLLGTGSHTAKAAGEYVCMDAVPHWYGDRNSKEGVILLPVQVRCGSLKCPPYKENQLVTCVVCSK